MEMNLDSDGHQHTAEKEDNLVRSTRKGKVGEQDQEDSADFRKEQVSYINKLRGVNETLSIDVDLSEEDDAISDDDLVDEEGEVHSFIWV